MIHIAAFLHEASEVLLWLAQRVDWYFEIRFHP